MQNAMRKIGMLAAGWMMAAPPIFAQPVSGGIAPMLNVAPGAPGQTTTGVIGVASPAPRSCAAGYEASPAALQSDSLAVCVVHVGGDNPCAGQPDATPCGANGLECCAAGTANPCYAGAYACSERAGDSARAACCQSR